MQGYKAGSLMSDVDSVFTVHLELMHFVGIVHHASCVTSDPTHSKFDICCTYRLRDLCV